MVLQTQLIQWWVREGVQAWLCKCCVSVQSRSTAHDLSAVLSFLGRRSGQPFRQRVTVSGQPPSAARSARICSQHRAASRCPGRWYQEILGKVSAPASGPLRSSRVLASRNWAVFPGSSPPSAPFTAPAFFGSLFETGSPHSHRFLHAERLSRPQPGPSAMASNAEGGSCTDGGSVVSPAHLCVRACPPSCCSSS